MTRIGAALLVAAVAAAFCGRSAVAADKARAALADADGKPVGTVKLDDAPHGVLIDATFDGLSPGMHGFHVHQTGKCEPPSFKSAGKHFSPDGKKHGMKATHSMHLGDLPNLHVPDSGKLHVEIFLHDVSLKKGEPHSLLDSDGSAIVVHARADNYKSVDSAGDRVACGVVEAEPGSTAKSQ